MKAEIESYQSEIFAEYLILKGFSNQTQGSIKNTVKRFAIWSEEQNIELQNITCNDVVAYVNYCKQQGNKQRTLQVTVGCIKHYYNFLINENEVVENPCSNVDIKGIKRKILYETFTTEELESIYKTFAGQAPSTGIGSNLTLKRNKIILGLIIYQGIRTEELARLTIVDVKLREGKIFIAGGRRTNEREMTLEAHQLYDLMDYINETRKMILSLTGKNTDALFLSLGSGDKFHNVMDKLLKQLKKQNSKIKDVKQLRASVITNWLKVHNIRKAQHLAGHRFVSSTEAYQANNMDDLKEDVNKYHPDF
ncbi:MAG: tyrosine-type recombinase/integrase [Bacteroidetes bacterium]|nr:tyrosine-type recombinase/integrase [Bacteroidota bacterium]